MAQQRLGDWETSPAQPSPSLRAQRTLQVPGKAANTPGPTPCALRPALWVEGLKTEN